MGIDFEYERVCVSTRITLIVTLTQPSLSDTKGHLLANVLEEATTQLRHDCIQWLKNSSYCLALLSSGLASLSGGLSPPGKTPPMSLEPRRSGFSFPQFIDIILHKIHSSVGGRGEDLCSSFSWYQHSNFLLGSYPFRISAHGTLTGTSALLRSYLSTSHWPRKATC